MDRSRFSLYKVRLLDGRTGYIPNEFTYQVTDTQAGFQQIDGQWKLMFSMAAASNLSALDFTWVRWFATLRSKAETTTMNTWIKWGFALELFVLVALLGWFASLALLLGISGARETEFNWLPPVLFILICTALQAAALTTWLRGSLKTALVLHAVGLILPTILALSGLFDAPSLAPFESSPHQWYWLNVLFPCALLWSAAGFVWKHVQGATRS